MDKKGISIIIGYVLLVVMAISLSLLVYAWLKYYLPKEIEKCPDSVSLIISDYECNQEDKEISLTLKNQGFFNIYGFIARVRNNGFFYELKDDEGKTRHYFEAWGFLKPNNESTKSFSYSEYVYILEIEIQPFIIGDKGEILLCDNAIISQKLENCN